MARNRKPQQAPQTEAPVTTGLLQQVKPQEQPNWSSEADEVTSHYESRFQTNLATMPVQTGRPSVMQTKQTVGPVGNKNITPKQLQAKGEPAENRTGMPDHLKSGLEQLSGFELSNVRVHYNSAKPAQLKALAYAQGQDIHLGPGQEQQLPHEGWHVVQQMQGRVKPHYKVQGMLFNEDRQLEREADVWGKRAKHNAHIMATIAHRPFSEFRRAHRLRKPSESPTIGKQSGDEASKGKGVENNNNQPITTLHVNEGRGIVQGIFAHEGEYYRNLLEIYYRDELKAVWKEIADTKKRQKLLAPRTVYELRDGALLENSTMTHEWVNAIKLQNWTPLTQNLTVIEPTQGTSGYEVTIDEGAGFHRDGQHQIVGTSGLNGCVAIMIDYHLNQGSGYFVTHVFSAHIGRQELIQEMEKVRKALSKGAKQEMTWRDIAIATSPQSPGNEEPPIYVTLVRQASPRPHHVGNTYVGLSRLLVQYGVHHKQATSKAVYFKTGNSQRNNLVKPPPGRMMLDRTRADIPRQYGYGETREVDEQE